MNKRRRDLWDDGTFNFSKKPTYHDSGSQGDIEVVETTEEEIFEPEMTEGFEDAEFLDEAHEALSKLFNKSYKRTQAMRGLRKRDAWQ